MREFADRGEGVKKYEIFADVINGSPPSEKIQGRGRAWKLYSSLAELRASERSLVLVRVRRRWKMER